MKKTNLLKTLAAVATVLIGLMFTQCGVSDKQIQNEVNKLNKMMNCPVKVDYMTILDSIYSMTGREIHYHYTIFNHTNEDMDGIVSKSDFKKNIRTALLDNVNANTSDARQFRSWKISLTAHYYDKNGDLYTEVKVGPKEYE